METSKLCKSPVVCSVPFINKEPHTIKTADIDGHGKIHHFVEPVYNGNPIDAKGSLVTYHWGYDMIDLIMQSCGMISTIYCEDRGIDGGKKVKGRKRHIVVNTMGNLLAVAVHAANIHDTKSGISPAKIAFEKYPTIKKFCGDGGYRKSFVEAVSSELGLDVDISEKILSGWAIIPKRWVIERTFAWANNSRRLSKDYEITTSSEEAFFTISHFRVLLRRLAKSL